MDYEVEAYEYNDLETPSNEFVRFANKVERLKAKEEKPNVKPEKVFQGYKKPAARKSKRLEDKKSSSDSQLKK